jgi:predicted DNA-binding transcriptional regulator YafY
MRADRLLAIMLLLQTRGKMTAQSLADRLEVSRRTILRDIDALAAAGVPVYAEGGHGGGVVLDEHYRTTLAGMLEQEVRTLFVGDNTKLLSEIGLGDAAQSTLLKLQAIVPDSHKPAVNHMRQRILIDPVWWWRDSQPLPFWDQLQRAVYEDRPIQTVYERHNGELIERILEPYSLVAKSSVWYLIADHGGALHTYRVVRFRQISLLDRHFQRRAGFDLQTYWQAQLQQFEELVDEYAFTLRIHPDQISFVKEVVPGRYQQVGPADSAGWITLQFQLASLDFAKMLVFGLGARAVIVEPQELLKAIRDTAYAMLGRHDEPTEDSSLNVKEDGSQWRR